MSEMGSSAAVDGPHGHVRLYGDFNHRYDRVVLNEGGETRFAIVVVALLHKGAPINWPLIEATNLALSRRLLHSILYGAEA